MACTVLNTILLRTWAVWLLSLRQTTRAGCCRGFLPLSLGNLAHFPAPDEPQAGRGAEIHAAGEYLDSQIRGAMFGLIPQHQRNRLRDRRRRHQDDPGETEPAREVPQADDLREDRGHRGPVGPRNGAHDDGEEAEHAHAAGEDPDDEAEQAAQEREEGGDVDAAESVAEHAHEGSSEALAQVQEGADDAALVRGETDREGKVRQAE